MLGSRTHRACERRGNCAWRVDADASALVTSFSKTSRRLEALGGECLGLVSVGERPTGMGEGREVVRSGGVEEMVVLIELGATGG